MENWELLKLIDEQGYITRKEAPCLKFRECALELFHKLDDDPTNKKKLKLSAICYNDLLADNYFIFDATLSQDKADEIFKEMDREYWNESSY